MYQFLKKHFTLPDFEDPEINRQARINRAINGLLIVIVLVYFIVSLFIIDEKTQTIFVSVFSSGIILIVAIAHLLIRRGKLYEASHILVGTFWVIFTGVAIFTGGVISPAYVSHTSLVLLVGFLLGKRSGIIYACVSAIAGLGLVYLESAKLLPRPVFINTPLLWWMSLTPSYIIAIIVMQLAIKNITESLVDKKQHKEELEESNRKLFRRTMQLQTAADVGRNAAEVHDLEKLLPEVTLLISDRFGYYHVAVFLLDEQGEYAVLRAVNSEGGQRMLADNHRLLVGKQGIVGYVAASQQPRIALDVGEDAVYFDNPHLGVTRSEIALPLVSSGQMLGVLDVQSQEPIAFSQPDIATLQVLADQVAMAIQNAQLFGQMHKLLDELENRVLERTSELQERNIQLENAYQALQKNQQKLLIAEKMASLGRLTAGIAHEMNTPLAVVRASLVELDTLVQEYQTSIDDPGVTLDDHNEIAEDMHSTIGLASKAASRSAAFIRDIKSQTKSQAAATNRVQKINPVQIIDESLLLLEHVLRKNHCSVDFSYPDDPIVWYLAPTKLSQVITNLVTNAVDASVSNGKGHIDLQLESNSEQLTIQLSDDGCGIPAENMAKIFDPMFTTKGRTENMGLGLMIVHDIVVAEFGGEISVDSKLGEGTTFIIQIPKLSDNKA